MRTFFTPEARVVFNIVGMLHMGAMAVTVSADRPMWALISVVGFSCGLAMQIVRE